MGQKGPILKRQKPILTHTPIDLLKLLQELEDLREKVRLAEAARVLH
jgi:hypothetical protein